MHIAGNFVAHVFNGILFFKYGDLFFCGPFFTNVSEDKKAKNPEEEVMVKLSAWHELRLNFNKAGLESQWQQISTADLMVIRVC